ncbi:MAG: type II toxin-antitoxin system RelE/ParE family toxin [Kiritimatiellae bacterium]|nr:type II toxin-antitoxin system RelE/ParE family toxin [Kiritimatiellia bacterium]MBQ3341867.1 type II toxin-antitoxin system RelE/ParE family toxin [Kiritimatiellia bacterium]
MAVNFYPEYAVAFANDVTDTAAMLPTNPKLGVEAFPSIRRPQYRKMLCKNRCWWIYYRIMNDRIEILSVKHALQNVLSPRDL